MTTKREYERRTRMNDTLRNLGFTRDECDSLRRISMTLRSWHERECGTDNGCIERDETTNKAYWLDSRSMKRYPIRDMEAGALKRLAAIITARNKRDYPYIPAPVSAYILRPGDVPDGQTADCCYSRGICVY